MEECIYVLAEICTRKRTRVSKNNYEARRKESVESVESADALIFRRSTTFLYTEYRRVPRSVLGTLETHLRVSNRPDSLWSCLTPPDPASGPFASPTAHRRS